MACRNPNLIYRGSPAAVNGIMVRQRSGPFKQSVRKSAVAPPRIEQGPIRPACLTRSLLRDVQGPYPRPGSGLVQSPPLARNPASRTPCRSPESAALRSSGIPSAARPSPRSWRNRPVHHSPRWRGEFFRWSIRFASIRRWKGSRGGKPLDRAGRSGEARPRKQAWFLFQAATRRTACLPKPRRETRPSPRPGRRRCGSGVNGPQVGPRARGEHPHGKFW